MWKPVVLTFDLTFLRKFFGVPKIRPVKSSSGSQPRQPASGSQPASQQQQQQQRSSGGNVRRYCHVCCSVTAQRRESVEMICGCSVLFYLGSSPLCYSGGPPFRGHSFRGEECGVVKGNSSPLTWDFKLR